MATYEKLKIYSSKKMLYEFYEEGRDIVTCGAVSDKFFMLYHRIQVNVLQSLVLDSVINSKLYSDFS